MTRILLLVICALVTLTGCKPVGSGGDAVNAVAAPVDFEVRQDTAENAAKTALRAIQATLRAEHARQPELSRAYFEKLRVVAAERDITERFERAPQYRAAIHGDDLVAGVLRNWMAAVAYYVRGVDFEQVKSVPLSSAAGAGEPAIVLVRVLAHGRDDDAWIQLRCVQGLDRLWRVSLISFHVPKDNGETASGPSRAATTQPAATTGPVSPSQPAHTEPRRP